jgi:hypothetical protein
MTNLLESPSVSVDGVEWIEKIHASARSEVWAARRGSDGQHIAVKILTGSCNDEEGRERLSRQVRWLRGHRIPCVPQYYSSIHRHEYTLITMELVDGFDPIETASRRNMTLPERVKLLAMICDAAQELHDHGVIHRDIKPSNVIIPFTEPMRAVFLDLDTVRFRDAETITAQGDVIGTKGFIAPEIVSGEPVTVRSDVYSIGRTAEALLDRIEDRQLQAITAKATARLSSQRYASAAAMAADLRRYLVGDSLEAMPSRLRRFVYESRRNWPFSAALACIVVLLFVAAVGWIQRGVALTEAEENMAQLVANLEMHERNAANTRSVKAGAHRVLEMLRGFRRSVDEHAEAGSFGEAMMHIRMLDDLREAAETIEPGSSTSFTDTRVSVAMDALRAMYTPPLTDHEEDFAAIRRALEQIETARKPKG